MSYTCTNCLTKLDSIFASAENFPGFYQLGQSSKFNKLKYETNNFKLLEQMRSELEVDTTLQGSTHLHPLGAAKGRVK